jgi:hypothetical protein
VLIVLTFAFEKIGRRDRDIFLLLTVIAIAMYLAAPIGMNGDLLLKARFLLFPYLIVLPWLTPRLARWPFAIVFALIAIANVFFIRDAWKRNDKLIAQAIAPLRTAVHSSTMLTLIFDRTSPHATVPVLSHAASYAAAERNLVDLGNYEAATGYFPIAFRDDVNRPEIFKLESAPQDYDPARYDVDTIYTWKLPPGSPIEQRLLAHYAVVRAEGEARVFTTRR